MAQRPPHCTFCDLIRGAAEVSICHEDADAIAFMDIQPVNAGHVLVVPREHYESLPDVPPEIGLHLFRVTMKLAGAVRRVTNCHDMNIVVNSGAAAGQDEPHYHVHIIPRRHGDGFDIPLPFNGSEMPDRTVLDAVAARIIAALRDPMRLGPRDDDGGNSDIEARGGHTDDDADRRSEPTERAMHVPVFTDALGSEQRARQGAAPVRAREGAHGELLRDDAGGIPEGGSR